MAGSQNLADFISHIYKKLFGGCRKVIRMAWDYIEMIAIYTPQFWVYGRTVPNLYTTLRCIRPERVKELLNLLFHVHMGNVLLNPCTAIYIWVLSCKVKVNQRLRYVHSCPELAILIMSTNSQNRTLKSVVLESFAKPNLACQFGSQGLVLTEDSSITNKE